MSYQVCTAVTTVVRGVEIGRAQPACEGTSVLAGSGRGSQGPDVWSDWEDWGVDEDWEAQAPLVDEEAQRRRRALRFASLFLSL